MHLSISPAQPKQGLQRTCETSETLGITNRQSSGYSRRLSRAASARNLRLWLTRQACRPLLLSSCVLPRLSFLYSPHPPPPKLCLSLCQSACLNASSLAPRATYSKLCPSPSLSAAPLPHTPCLQSSPQPPSVPPVLAALAPGAERGRWYYKSSGKREVLLRVYGLSLGSVSVSLTPSYLL